MRTLFYVPVIHAIQELGARGVALLVHMEAMFGADYTARQLTAREEFWHIIPTAVMEQLLASGVPWSNVHAFADSIPRSLTGNPDTFVPRWMTGFLFADSPMAKLLHELSQLGATVHGTEDEALLLAHSQYLDQIAHDPDQVDPNTSQRYLNLRDACVAMQVDAVVPDGHAAVLLMGAAHDVAPYLQAAGFQVERLDFLDEELKPRARG